MSAGLDASDDMGLGNVERLTPRSSWWSLLKVFVDRDVQSSDSDFQSVHIHRRWARSFHTRAGRRWTAWVWRQQPIACAIGLAVRLSAFAATLWWTAWLGFWLAGGSAPATTPSAMGMSAPPWLATLVMLAAAAVGGAAGLLQELTMRRTFFIRATHVLTDGSISDDLPASAFDRLRARDLLTLPDHLTAAVDIVFTPVALVSGLLWLALLFGAEAAGSGALAIGVTLLVTGLVGLKSLALAEPLIAAGGRRMDLVSRWLDRRWFLMRWGRAEAPLHELAEAAKRETDVMTRDSLWRGLEGYLSSFGIVFAVAGAVVAQWLFGASPSGLLAYAWTLLPMIDVALSQARVATQCSQAMQLLASVQQALSLRKPRAVTRGGTQEADDNDDSGARDARDASLRWDERWRLFDASLFDNLVPERCFGPAPDACVVPFAISLLRHLRLADELWGDQADDLLRATEFQVRDDGAELSAGQRVRVLFARAVLQAKARNLPLDVLHSLSALDADALRRAREAPVFAGIEVSWGDENLALFAAVDAIAGARARHSAMPQSQAMRVDPARVAIRPPAAPSPDDDVERLPWRRTGIARSAIAALRWFLPVALVAACGLFVLSQMLAARPGDASWRLLVDMALVAVPSLALVVAAGVLLERSMRRAALRAHADLLVAPGGDRSDLLQRLGRDFEVVTGRLAWYVHDLGWIAATAALGLLSLLVAFGPVGAGLVAAVATASVLLWRTLAPKVVSSRRLAAQGINRYLGVSANLRRLDGLQPFVRADLRRRYTARSLRLLWSTQAASIGSKGALSYYASLLGAVVLAAACVVGAWVEAPREALVFMVAALSAVDRLSATFVQGLAGLMAQSLSARRLCAAPLEPADGYERPDDGSRGARHAGGGGHPETAAEGIATDSTSSCFVLPESRNPIASSSYVRTEFPIGSMTLLVGPSGSGKTQFLRHHAECAARGRVLYFPRDTPALLGMPDGADWRAEVEVIVMRAARETQVCVFLDELSTLLPSMVARHWLAGLHRCIEARRGMLIVVDHRLTLDRVLRFDEVVGRSTVSSS
ncbi:MAG: putative rane protein [Rhizobacter sp.]|nr:putative rane protein [Rhizobacter sp.]